MARPACSPWCRGTGADLALNIHFHMLVLDGVFAASGAFTTIAPPTLDEMEALTATIATRIARMCQRRALDEADADSSELALLRAFALSAARAGASKHGIDPEHDDAPDWAGKLEARVDGYDLECTTVVRADDRERLEPREAAVHGAISGRVECSALRLIARELGALRSELDALARALRFALDRLALDPLALRRRASRRLARQRAIRTGAVVVAVSVGVRCRLAIHFAPALDPRVVHRRVVHRLDPPLVTVRARMSVFDAGMTCHEPGPPEAAALGIVVAIAHPLTVPRTRAAVNARRRPSVGVMLASVHASVMLPPARSSAARVDPAPPRAPGEPLRLEDVPAELRDTPIVRVLADPDPRTQAWLDDLAEFDREPPPGPGIVDWDDDE